MIRKFRSTELAEVWACRSILWLFSGGCQSTPGIPAM